MPAPDTADQFTVSEPDENPRRPREAWWRGLTGALAMGLAALAVLVAGAQFVGPGDGPGATAVLGHAGGALLALFAQRFADRGRGPVAAAAGVVVVALLGAVLWFFWWS